MAPADSPKTVTRSGSPPNAAMFVAHPGERGDLVEQAQVRAVVAVAEVEEAVRPVRQLMVTQTTPSRAKRLPS